MDETDRDFMTSLLQCDRRRQPPEATSDDDDRKWGHSCVTSSGSLPRRYKVRNKRGMQMIYNISLSRGRAKSTLVSLRNLGVTPACLLMM